MSNKPYKSSRAFYCLAGASSGPYPTASFPRPSRCGSVPTATFRRQCPLPLRLPVSVTGVQGVAANNTIPGHHRKVIVRVHTQHALHCVCHPSLQWPPSPPFRCGPSHHTKTACLGSFGNMPRFARRARHSGHSVCRLPLRYGRGQRLSLLTTSLHFITSCTLQPTEPVPPTVCVLETVCGGPAAFAESLTFPLRQHPNEIRSW